MRGPQERLPAWAAVIVAAGRGTRFGRPKQLIEIAGAPMLSWSVRVLAAMPEVTEIVVVTEREWLDAVASAAKKAGATHIVAGGASRQASVYEGLCAISPACENILVHDGARPFITAQEVRAGMAVVRSGHAGLLATRVVDTIKIVDEQTGEVAKTLDRGLLWAAQTPQFATLAEMLAAHEAGIRDGVRATDDAMLLERFGLTVHVVAGSAENFKVTLATDWERADRAMRARLVELH